MDDIYRGIIIVYPHGGYIANHTKTLIIKSKSFVNELDKPLLLIQDREALGIITLTSIKPINLSQFNHLKSKHKITDEERLRWWPNKKILYQYKFTINKIFKKPIQIDYKNGPQVFIKPNNIHIISSNNELKGGDNNDNDNSQMIYIGTSGYSYKWWNKTLYPVKASSNDQFKIYTDNFNSLEINSTFYKTYTKETWEKIKSKTPKDFTYAVKVMSSITHYYQFDKFNNFWQSAKTLLPYLKCLLFQFPEHFRNTPNNIARLKSLDTDIRCAFEFRHNSWYEDNTGDVAELFKSKKQWVMVISYYSKDWIIKKDLDEGFNPSLTNWIKHFNTSDFVYIRLHGTNGKYQGSQMIIMPELIEFIKSLNELKYVFVYFNNTDSIDKKNHLPDAINDAKFLESKLF